MKKVIKTAAWALALASTQTACLSISGTGSSGGTTCTHPSWETVDDYTAGFTGSGNGAGPWQMRIDAGGNVYATGTQSSDGFSTVYDVVRKGSTNGTSWSTFMSPYIYPGSTYDNEAYDLAFDSSDNPMFLLWGAVDAVNRYSVVERADSDGSNFTQASAYSTSQFTGMVYLPSSGKTVFVGGTGGIPTVRVSTDFGATGTFTVNGNFPGETEGVLWALWNGPSSSLVALGEGEIGGDYEATAFVSADEGSTWTNIDQFAYTGTSASAGNTYFGFAYDSSGNYYLSGAGAWDTSTVGSWVVRKSSDQGTTWSTVLGYQGGQMAAGGSIGVDTNGYVYTTGVMYDGATQHLMTWVSKNQGETWSISDDFSMAASSAYFGSQVPFAVDSSGNLYEASALPDSTGLWHWIVRRNACN